MDCAFAVPWARSLKPHVAMPEALNLPGSGQEVLPCEKATNGHFHSCWQKCGSMRMQRPAGSNLRTIPRPKGPPLPFSFAEHRTGLSVSPVSVETTTNVGEWSCNIHLWCPGYSTKEHRHVDLTHAAIRISAFGSTQFNLKTATTHQYACHGTPGP